MTDTRPPSDLDKSPFAGLFEKHPWLPSILMETRRILGIVSKYIEINAKPFVNRDKD